MAILKGILNDSWKHYRSQEVRIRSRLRQLPKGSILKRRLAGREYFYLKFRRNEKVVSRYLGKDRPVQLEKSIQERRLLQKQLRDVKQSLRLLVKVRRKKLRRG
ncbi:hypothetical protein HY522_02945 [bacterium]|nr:hypothetical protein [bacterium]